MNEIQLSKGKKAFIKPKLTAGDYDCVKEVYMDYLLSKKDDPKKEEDGKMYPAQVYTQAKYVLISTIIDRIEDGEKIVKPVSAEYLRGLEISDIEKLEIEGNKIKASSIIGEEAKKK